MAKEGKIVTPSELKVPAFLMCFPFTVANYAPNNPLMEGKGPYDLNCAFTQWLRLYRLLSRDALIYLMPHSDQWFQDLTFVANVGMVLSNANSVLVANFKSKPRRGEDHIADKFFRELGYYTYRPPFHWEGEADLKHLYEDVYVGGYGIRTDKPAFNWMRDKFGLDITAVKLTDERLFHFDCVFFPIEDRKALVVTSALDPLDVKLIEKCTEIVEVPARFAYDGWTNAVRLHRRVFYGIPGKIHSVARPEESKKALEALLESLGYAPVGVHLEEFGKSGADLSCLCLHLNDRNRE